MRFMAAILAVAALQAMAHAAEVRVADSEALGQAMKRAKPGTRILIAPGTYRPGVYAENLRGTEQAPIVIEAADPRDKPIFQGGQQAMHLSDCSYVVLRNVIVRGQSINGLNIDDGGSFDTPAHHIVLEGVEVYDVGPKGNHDPIKMSGVDDFVVRNCTISGWGGQAVDMVGCHRGVIEGCAFIGKSGFSQDSGPQTKGGSSQVTIRNCTFINAGQRGINIGGSTDMRVFRPQGAKYEAKDITVENCRFVGCMAPVAFVGVDGAVVRNNTIYMPDKWVLRILQETTENGFAPCRKGRFERNLVVFRSQPVQIIANVGPNTDPGSFIFRENYWYCADNPARSRVQLPAREEGGVYGVDPKLEVMENGAPGKAGAVQAKGFGCTP